jgi:3-oxoacyl-[acyl-carrier-protein] synthase II
MADSSRTADALVVSGWSAISPFGLGAKRFADGLLGGEPAVTEVDQEIWPGPFVRAGLVPDFTIVDVLGRKGTRSMDRATALAVATVGMLLEQNPAGLTDRPESIGLVLGTGSGSVQSIMDFTRDSLIGEKPFHVDPARFPNTVMNRAAGASAIWYGLKGPNTTIAGGALTGLLALNYAGRLFRREHCETIVCGAVEEFSIQRGWLECHARNRAAGPLGEGCATFLLESAGAAHRNGRTPLATVLGAGFGAFHRPGTAREALARCTAQALRRAGADPADVRVHVPSIAEGRLREQENAGVHDVVGTPPRRWNCLRQIGDTGAASAAFQLAAALAIGAEHPDLAGRLALVTSVERDGTVGCTVLRYGAGQAAS